LTLQIFCHSIEPALLLLSLSGKPQRNIQTPFRPKFLSYITMRPMQSLKYIFLFGILALSLVAEPSFAQSFDQTTKNNEVSFSGLFIQSFSIIVREGFETILIIAALISFLRKSKNDAHVKNIHIGVIVGILASFLTAYAVHEVLQLNMANQELLEGWIMLVSVVILFSVSYWLVSNIDNKKWQQYINKKMHGALSHGNTFALSAVAFISVYREGFETVLFYKALFLYAGKTTGGILPGFLTGCVMLAGVFYLVNYLGMRVPFKWFFGFTSVLLYYMAFTFLGKGIHELQMGEQFSMTAAKFLPNISWLGMYPTWETFIGQAILFAAFIFALVYTFIIKAKKEIE